MAEDLAIAAVDKWEIAAGFRGGNVIKETATILGVEESVVQDALRQIRH